MYVAIGGAGSGVFFKLAKCMGACAHGTGDFDVGGVAVDVLPKGFEGAVVLFGFGMCLPNAQHGIGQSLAVGVVDDELFVFSRGVGIESIAVDPLGEFVMRVFVLGPLRAEVG